MLLKNQFKKMAHEFYHLKWNTNLAFKSFYSSLG